MSRSAILALLLCGTLPLALGTGACVRHARAPVLPRPAAPAEPRTPQDRLLRTALADVLREPREFIRPADGPVLLLRNGPHVSPRILPTGTPHGIALVSAEQLETLASRDGGDRHFYLTVQVASMAGDEAVVNVQLFPAIPKGSIALCCWTIDRRYLRTGDEWRFDRLVDEGVY